MAWPRSICSQAGQRWSSWVLVAGSALESRSARASQHDTCDDRTTLPDRVQAVCAAGITGSWSVEQGAGLTPLARWFPSWQRSVPDRLAQTFPSFGDRLVRNLHRAPHPSRRTADCPLPRQHGPMYGNFWLWVTVLARMERIGFSQSYRLREPVRLPAREAQRRSVARPWLAGNAYA